MEASASVSHDSPQASSSSSSVDSPPKLLACLRCKGKKNKCEGTGPVCVSCIKANTVCVRPTGRKRKRTRKEMEQARIEEESQKSSRLSAEQNSVSKTTIYSNKSPLPPLPVSHTSSSFMPVIDSALQVSSPSVVDPEEVVEALRKQITYLEGEPGESQTLKVHYYRFSGSTAIHPGFNRIVIKLRSSTRTSPSTTSSLPSTDNLHTQCCPSDLVLNCSESQPPDCSLIVIFFRHFGQHFPFLQQERVYERLKDGTMSAFLLRAMNAVAVRFSPHAQHTPAYYIESAWKLALPLLRLPSTDVVGGLLILAWAEFGENSESGLWNFSGLAIRMGLDLGLHKTDEDAPDDACGRKHLFWSLFIIDRVLAMGTGRPVTIPEDSIEVRIPTDTEFRGFLGQTPSNVALHPFPKIVYLFSLCGRIANVMNGSRGCPRTLAPLDIPNPLGLQLLQNQLVEFLTTLPSELCWSVDNFRKQAEALQGGSFLFLHLWANATLALLHHPNLGRNTSGYDTPISAGVKRSIKLSLASSRQIADCLVFADLFDAMSYCATPFINQCLFIAGVAFIYDAQTLDMSTGAQSDSDVFLSGLVKQNLSVLFKALKRMEVYWSGLGYIINVLEQRANGNGWDKVDFSISSDTAQNFISLPDTGILRRITQNPSTSTKHSINESEPDVLHSKETTSSTEFLGFLDDLDNNWSFESLLSSYQIEEVTASSRGLDLSSVFPHGLSW